MKRCWIGLALLSASWLFGLSYYHDAAWPIWIVLVTAGTGLLIGVRIRRPARFEIIAAALMSLPAIYLIPWPYRTAPLLFTAGLVLYVLPIPRRWPKVLASAVILAGIILLAQSLSILCYESITARTHELPRPLPDLLYAITKVLGITSSFDGSNLALYTRDLYIFSVLHGSCCWTRL